MVHKFYIVSSVSLCLFTIVHLNGADLTSSYTRLNKHVLQLRVWAQQHRAAFTSQPVSYSLPKHCGGVCEMIIKNISFLHDGYIQFQHDDVRACVAVIQQEERLDAFFTMWQSFTQRTSGTVFDHPDDELFLKECGTLILLFYNNILRSYGVDTLHRISVQDIMEMYDAIAKLPLDELLDVLDVVLDKVILILQSEALNKPDQNIFEWLHENWWVPPVVLGALVAQLLLY
jgi:hypothetical protein